MKALIDGDICVYRVGFTTQDEETWVAEARMRELINGILIDTNADNHEIFLTSTDKSNFRYKLYPEYKANRKQEKPTHYEFLRDYLEEIHGATVVFGQEADDELGIAQTEDTIICSIDKDLDQIEGWHFNWVKGMKYYITPEEGRTNFYQQLLIGDVSDNIPGCPGIGKVKAANLIIPDMEEEDMKETVVNQYIKQYKKKKIECDPIKDLVRNARLLRMKRSHDELLWSL